MSSALTYQVSGNHYKKMAFQPIELTMHLGYDSCLHSAVKYIARHRDKGHADDLRKALHFIELRHEIRAAGSFVCTPAKPDPDALMEYFIEVNRIPGDEGAILLALDRWNKSSVDKSGDEHVMRTLRLQIRALIFNAYGEQP